MKFTAAPITGAYVIDVQRIGDERGFFGRLWCHREFENMGLVATIVQSNIGVSKTAGTLRGLHFQRPPHQEVKIIRCPRGAIFDVIVDLRPESPTFKRWFGVVLSQENNSMLYVPEGCATGYLTLRDDTEIYYHTSKAYQPDSAAGVRWDDPALGIEWPAEIRVVSENDRNWPNFTG
jgi:dTDP-4-dehydrorhamnose 3,5-epimerase